ncbi:MAG: thiopurine S-methyltransferase [Calditrichaeota bacterium]|nr:thiopurine S-methyltransferase [Calditrichota bacterium]
MDAEYWLDGWRHDHKPFHQRRINPHLQAHWSRLDPGKDARVLVPLCGRSLDMGWIASQGCRVLGVELAPEPVRAFFDELGQEPVCQDLPPFRRWCAQNLELLQGDFFRLNPEHTSDCRAIYDRASLPALPPEMRQLYASTLARVAPVGCRSLLIVPVYEQSQMQPPPFSVDHEEVMSLFGPHWSVELLEEQEMPVAPRFAERGLKGIRERVYLLRRGESS